MSTKALVLQATGSDVDLAKKRQDYFCCVYVFATAFLRPNMAHVRYLIDFNECARVAPTDSYSDYAESFCLSTPHRNEDLDALPMAAMFLTRFHLDQAAS